MTRPLRGRAPGGEQCDRDGGQEATAHEVSLPEIVTPTLPGKRAASVTGGQKS